MSSSSCNANWLSYSVGFKHLNEFYSKTLVILTAANDRIISYIQYNYCYIVIYFVGWLIWWEVLVDQLWDKHLCLVFYRRMLIICDHKIQFVELCLFCRFYKTSILLKTNMKMNNRHFACKQLAMNNTKDSLKIRNDAM